MPISCHAQQDTETATSHVRGAEYILVVDDDPGISDLVTMVLRDEVGYTVEAVSTLRQVLSRPPERAPRMLLLDATLPGENVVETSAELRRLPGWNATPIVLCSGRQDVARMARELDAAAYLMKPFDIEELIALAEAFVS